jgi:queuosine precursor transporter
LSKFNYLKSTKKSVEHEANWLYLLLAVLFITSLIACNLIANKFVEVDFGFYVFTLSAGVLPYPITFLITDVLSEIYGRQKTNQVVFMGFAALLFTLFILWLGSLFPSIASSPVSDQLYQTAFGNSWRVIAASMVAYLFAQFIDVRLFHFWKKLTKGKHLWLRNNASTILSQLVDTALVVSVLFLGDLELGQIGSFIRDGWAFKTICALLDTPIFYLVIWIFRRRFKLKLGQELK